MSLIDLQRRAVELCCAPEPRDELAEALGDLRVWSLYRELIRNRLRGELRTALPRTYRAAGPEAFDRAFEHHMHRAPPRTRFFHAVVAAFVRSAAPLFRSDPAVPAHVADLAEYEGALWAASDLPDACERPAAEFTFDRPALLSPALCLLSLRHAVHREPDAEGAYASGEFFLCVHRRPEEKKARTFELNAVSFQLMQCLTEQPAPSVTEAVQRVAAARGLVVDQKFLDGLCGVLATFIERGIILGAC